MTAQGITLPRHWRSNLNCNAATNIVGLVSVTGPVMTAPETANPSNSFAIAAATLYPVLTAGGVASHFACEVESSIDGAAFSNVGQASPLVWRKAAAESLIGERWAVTLIASRVAFGGVGGVRTVQFRVRATAVTNLSSLFANLWSGIHELPPFFV